MADIETTTENKGGFRATNEIGEYGLDIDARGETAPSPNQILVADYASCYTFAFRAGAMRSESEYELGRIETEATADLDENDDLEAIDFLLEVEADLTENEIKDLTNMAEEICHVHAALQETLHAEVTVESDAF